MNRFDDINQASRAVAKSPRHLARIDHADENRPWRQRSGGASVWSERVLRRWWEEASDRGWARCDGCGEAMLPVGRLAGVWIALRDPRVPGWRLAGDHVLRRARHHMNRVRIAEEAGAAEWVDWADLTWPLPADVECPQCHRLNRIVSE